MAPGAGDVCAAEGHPVHPGRGVSGAKGRPGVDRAAGGIDPGSCRGRSAAEMSGQPCSI